MNRIASDEPDEVGILPKPITFWYRGKEHQAAVSSSNVRHVGGVHLLMGDFGRAWLADPCSMALHEGLHGRAMTRAEDAKREREIQKRLKGG